MDPRYSSGRLSPPPRRYAAPGRNSTGRLDADYESYYSPSRSAHSIVPGPRTSGERIVPRMDPRLGSSSPRSSRDDDYYVAPRYSDTVQNSRRPLSIIAPAGSSSRYQPAISSAADLTSSPYRRSRGRDDESFYIQPAVTSHGRHFSVGSSELRQVAALRDRDRDRESPLHREYLSPGISRRDPRDRDHGYEYSSRDPFYRDDASRHRTRRVSDIDSRDRPSSVNLGTADDYRRQGPPVTTRGLSRLDGDGATHREYRYARDEPRSRDSSLHRSSRDERDRMKSSRGKVTVHQDDGNSSNNERTREKSHRHRHRHHDSSSQDRHGGDERRSEEPTRKHHGSDYEDRHRKPHKHKDDIHERIGSRDVRDDGYERDDDRDRQRRNEPHRSKHEGRKVAEGAAIGAAALGAGGLIAESVRNRHGELSSEENSDAIKDRSRHQQHREDAETQQQQDDGSGDTEEDRRERRRRRRRERTERERREELEAGANSDDRRERNPDNRHDSIPDNRHDRNPEDRHDRNPHQPIIPVLESEDSREIRSEESEANKGHRRSRRRRDRGSSSDSSSEEESRRVRVVSPERDPNKKPKSILRQPTQKFPEDPAPIREGVAPLKGAGQKGIPPDARWTKISRKLINPEALELAKERYEHDDETVTILRVVTKEEIEKFALITQHLRSQRPASTRSGGETSREIDDHPHDDSSGSEKPRQIAAQAYNEEERSEPQAPKVKVENDEEDDQDRPSLQKEQSYQRFAPPGYQPPSNIPVYPAIPGRSQAIPSSTSSASQATHDPTYPGQGSSYRSSQS